jgi:putative CocE/NonD family hydrolase
MFLQALRARSLRTLADRLPLGDLDQLATGHTVSYWQDWLASDEGFWDRHQFGTGPQRTSAAVAMIGGWHDFFLPAQLRDYAALRQAGHEPSLMIGPWRHADNEGGAAWVRSGLEFLRAQLGGQPADGQANPVRIFVTGAEEWRSVPAWPPPAVAQCWYLQSHGGLAMTTPGGSAPDTYSYDPVDPTPNLAGPVGSQGRARVDNRILEARPDVLTFTSTGLPASLEVIGVPAVDLHVSSDREHTDFFARLCEVNPAGQSLNICDGLLRLSPGLPETRADGTRRVRFELWPVAHRFGAGNRLRLQVSSGAHPRYARNAGTGEPLATATTLVTARQAVYHDPGHLSAVILPVVPT